MKYTHKQQLRRYDYILRRINRLKNRETNRIEHPKNEQMYI